jgi:hypothetical protein
LIVIVQDTFLEDSIDCILLKGDTKIGQLVHHPGHGYVGELLIGETTADVGVRAAEPDLPEIGADTARSFPDGWGK